MNPARPPLRAYAFSEFFQPNFEPHSLPERALRDRRWKIVERAVLPDGFYDLQRDPYEEHNLLRLGPLGPEQQAAYDRLQGELARILGP